MESETLPRPPASALLPNMKPTAAIDLAHRLLHRFGWSVGEARFKLPNGPRSWQVDASKSRLQRPSSAAHSPRSRIAKLRGREVHRGLKYAYDGWGDETREWQALTGSVDTESAPSVQYEYDDGAVEGVAQHVRLTDVIYPNGRDISYLSDSNANVTAVVSFSGGTWGVRERYVCDALHGKPRCQRNSVAEENNESEPTGQCYFRLVPLLLSRRTVLYSVRCYLGSTPLRCSGCEPFSAGGTR
jgi:hypothetical protein